MSLEVFMDQLESLPDTRIGRRTRIRFLELNVEKDSTVKFRATYSTLTDEITIVIFHERAGERATATTFPSSAIPAIERHLYENGIFAVLMKEVETDARSMVKEAKRNLVDKFEA